jgi:hypothetical protein
VRPYPEFNAISNGIDIRKLIFQELRVAITEPPPLAQQDA